MISALLLAAGQSQRMGQPKPLLQWRGQPLVRHMAQLALAAEIDDLVVVTGYEAAAVAPVIADLPVTILHNPRFAAGQSTSLIAGLAALSYATTAVLVLLVDQPLLTSELLSTLAAAARSNPGRIIVPTYGEQCGTPVALPRSLWPAVAQLQGDRGARQLFADYPEQVLLVPVDSPAVLQDADTPAAYAALLAADETP